MCVAVVSPRERKTAVSCLVVDWLTCGGFSASNRAPPGNSPAGRPLFEPWLEMVVVVPVHCLMGRHLASPFPAE